MSELKMISPLLDGMTVEQEDAGHHGRTCYTLRNEESGERFILKKIAVPASDSQVRALILSGAYPDEASVHAYYGGVVAAIKTELEAEKELAASGCFAGVVSYQIEENPSGVGFEIYILYPLYVPLTDILAKSAMTGLRAVNLGIDLCDAISACRDAGYLYGNLKPENVYFMKSGKFLIGDLGLVPLQDLKYSCIPEEYLGEFSAPELSDITASPNMTIDLYSLGMVLYRVYNGNHGPFEDENTGAAMADKLRMSGKPLPTPIYADYEMASIILKACAFQQSERFQSPEELKQALVLYMQRNEVSDELIVPPIVTGPLPSIEEAEPETADETPIRMTDVEQLDENFRRSFAPDLSGAGTENDVDKTVTLPEQSKKPAPQPEKAPQATPEAENEAPAAQQPPEPTQEIPTAEHPAQEPSEETDPDQIDIDSLLASVNEIVGKTAAPEQMQEQEATAASEEQAARQTPPELTPAHDYVDEDTEPEEDEPEQPPKRKSRLVTALVLAVLVLAIIGIGYFLLRWYFVDVNKLNMVSCTVDEVVIELESEDELDRFVLSCTDSYGNAYPVTVDGNRYTFSSLSEKTTYTITVTAAKHHKLSAASTYTLTVTTPETTQITEFSAVRADADGEVLLSVTADGPVPSQWKLSYTDDSGAETKSFEFSGNDYLVTGLELNKVYTFTLENTENVNLSGQTTVQYELLPIVEVKNLNITGIDGKNVTLEWECGENVPDEWTITCEADGLSDVTGTSAGMSYTLELPDFNRDYRISVKAAGMDVAETLLLPANPFVVEDLHATANEDGTVTVNWNMPAGTPDGGWYLFYNTVGSKHNAYIFGGDDRAVSGNSATLSGLIPNAEYEISLSLTADNNSATVFGKTTTTVKTPEAEAFDEFGVTPEPPLNAASGYISLWTLPSKEDWNYTDLSNVKTYFGVDEKIAACIEINAVNASDDEVTLMYVIRDEDGNVVNDVSKTLPWNDVWYSRRHASEIPLPAAQGEPSAAGSYRLEIYVNGKLLASAGFQIAQ